MVGNIDCLRALPVLCQRQGTLYLHFEPHLPDVRASLLALEKAIAEQSSRFLELSGLSQIQNEFINQGRGHIGSIRIAFQSGYTFLRWTLQDAQRLIHSRIK